MKVILLSGGSGQRLWPLSNTNRSEQYLKLLQSPDQGHESMIQRIWRQLNAMDLLEHTYLSTNKDQVDSIHNQLGNDVHLIVEPEQRNTFPSIALAAAYLHSVEKIDPNEVICVMHADHYVENDFFQALIQLERTLQSSDADLLLLAHASSEPSEKTIKNKALWNHRGIYAFRLKYVIDLLEIEGVETDYDQLIAQYDTLPNIHFEVEVVKESNHVIITPFSGYWKDLSTWGDYTQEMETNIIGKGKVSDDAANVHLINETNVPVVVNGISDVVVAVSPGGILISDKEKSSAIQPLVQDFLGRPMIEERRWGSYRVLDYEILPDGSKVLTKSISLKPGKNISYQTHAKRSEVWTIVSGNGLFVLDDHMQEVAPGDVLEIPVGSKHALKAVTDLQFIEVQIGSDLIETDIRRICMTWEEVELRCAEGK